jgi:hypothetical protein
MCGVESRPDVLNGVRVWDGRAGTNGPTREALRSRRRPRPRIRPRGVMEYWSTAPNPNCSRVAGWRCFQGDLLDVHPGLTPWAILLDHFMVKNPRPPSTFSY